MASFGMYFFHCINPCGTYDISIGIDTLQKFYFKIGMTCIHMWYDIWYIFSLYCAKYIVSSFGACTVVYFKNIVILGTDTHCPLLVCIYTVPKLLVLACYIT